MAEEDSEIFTAEIAKMNMAELRAKIKSKGSTFSSRKRDDLEKELLSLLSVGEQVQITAVNSDIENTNYDNDSRINQGQLTELGARQPHRRNESQSLLTDTTPTNANVPHSSVEERASTIDKTSLDSPSPSQLVRFATTCRVSLTRPSEDSTINSTMYSHDIIRSPDSLTDHLHPVNKDVVFRTRLDYPRGYVGNGPRLVDRVVKSRGALLLELISAVEHPDVAHLDDLLTSEDYMAVLDEKDLKVRRKLTLEVLLVFKNKIS